jgi:hypothetical protein
MKRENPARGANFLRPHVGQAPRNSFLPAVS